MSNCNKITELTERLRRAEDIIREALRDTTIYYNGNALSIKEKDGKDRAYRSVEPSCRTRILSIRVGKLFL